MHDAIRFHSFRTDQDEHQIEPNDRVRATYLVSNQSEGVVLFDVRLTHHDRVDHEGRAVLRCEPGSVELEGSLQPHEERQVSIELVTIDHLPGRHPLKVSATFDCRPVSPVAEVLFEFSVSPD